MSSQRPPLIKRVRGRFETHPLTKNSVPWLVLLLSISGFLSSHIFGMAFTGWDSRDVGLVNFTYFSDCLKAGVFPLWNPFILAGDFFYNIFNVFVLSPITVPFEIVAWVVGSPLAFEWYIVFGCLLAGTGVYFLGTELGIEPWVGAWSGICYTLLLCVPILGQVGFIYSLAGLPWLIWAIKRLHSGASLWKNFWTFVAVSSIMTNGYTWLNACSFAIGAILHLAWLLESGHRGRWRKTTIGVTGAIIPLMLCYGVLLLPGFLNLSSNYANMGVGFATPEPRLRSLATQPLPSMIGLGGGFDSFRLTLSFAFSLVDPGSGKSEYVLWSDGVGLVLTGFLLVGSLRSGWVKRHWGLLLLTFCAFLYSTGLIWPIIQRFPVLNSNRWIRIGNYFIVAFLLVIVTRDISDPPSSEGLKKWKLVSVGIVTIAIAVAILTKGNWLSILVLAIAMILATLASFGGKYRQSLRGFGLVLSLVLIAGRAFVLNDGIASNNMQATRNGEYSDRVSNPVYVGNERKLGAGRDYEYNDISWLLEKRPISHGYDNQSDPLYWYVKDALFMSKLAFMAEQTVVRPSWSKAEKMQSSDQALLYMEAIAPEGWPVVIEEQHHGSLPAGPANSVLSVVVAPNTFLIKCHVESPTYLIVNNHWYSGWEAKVDGKFRELFRANRIFQGLRLDPGDTVVELTFSPWVVYLLLVPYFILLASLLFLLATRRKRQ